ncbi:MAG: hypothetical protein EoVTN8_144 [Fluviibacter phosphoraccumulans EoVTN8]
MLFRRVRRTLFTLVTCLISVPSLAAPERLVITRHGEKLNTWQLCQTGLDRAQALSDQYLGSSATDPVFPGGSPAAIMTLTIHTSETAEPTAHSWGMPATAYLALPGTNRSAAQLETEIDQQNRQAVQDLMNNPAYSGKQVLMVWEHFHTASSALESRYPDQPVTLRQLLHLDQPVTLRQLLHLDQPPFAELVPATWPDSNYNFFWIVGFNPDGSIKAFDTKRQRYSGRYTNLPDNAWGTPNNLPVSSHCLSN